MIIRRGRWAAILVLALALGACSGVSRRPLASDVLDQINGTEVVLGVAQQALNAQIQESNVAGAMGGGLLPALVDMAINSSRSGTAEEAVQPLRDALLDFRFNDRLQAEIDQHLQAIRGLGAAKSVLVSDVSEGSFFSLHEASAQKAVLLVRADYQLSPDFSSLIVSASAQLFAKDSGLRTAAGLKKKKRRYKGRLDPAQAIYQNTVRYAATLPNAGALDANRQRWAADQALLLRGSLARGAEEVATLLSLDLQAPTNAALPPGVDGHGIRRERTAAGALLASGPATAEAPASSASHLPAPVAGTVTGAAENQAVVNPAYGPAPQSNTRSAAVAGSGFVLPAAASLRMQPKAAAEILATLPAGSSVDLLRSIANTEGSWWYAKAAGQNGWLSAAELP